MQIHLSDITHILELETSDAGSIHYQCGFTDITTAAVANPSDSQGIITTATTTTIVTAPAASTVRKVQYISVYNNGITNVIKLKKDISGTEYIIIGVTLQNGETLRIVNDKVTVLDSGGREKTQNTGDSEILADVRSILKVGTAPEAAGQFYSHSKDAGYPGAWSVGTPGVNGRNTDGTQAADNGCLQVGIPASGSWYVRDANISATVVGQFNLFDVLWVNSGLVVTTTTAQSITQPTLPARDNNGSTNGLGIYAGILVTTATTNGSAITNMTMSYTNSDGTSGRTATIASFPATAVIGTFVPFLLAAGDKGIRSIQSITLGTSLVAGAISLICFNPILSNSVLLANTGSLAYPKKLDLRLYDGHCLIPFWLAASTTATTINGNIYFVNK